MQYKVVLFLHSKHALVRLEMKFNRVRDEIQEVVRRKFNFKKGL